MSANRAGKQGKKLLEGGHILDTVERLKAVADPLRLRLVLELIDGNRTVKELAEAVGVPPTRLYYHVKILEGNGLIEVANRRMVSGIEERTYRVASKDWTVPPEISPSALYESGALRALFDMVRSEVEVAVQDTPDTPMDAPGSPLAGIGLTEVDLSVEDLKELRRTFEEALSKFATGKRRKKTTERYRFFYSLYASPTAPARKEEE